MVNRREVLSSFLILPAAARGANDRVNVGFIGMGKMGRSNLFYAQRDPRVAVSHLCDVYDLNLERTRKPQDVKLTKDFREVLADKSVDAVCISTPDHWHAYMTVEACRQGKDVFVEKPVSVTLEESAAMVAAARKHARVVQAGTMQRSAVHFREAADIVRRGELGKITFVRTWNYGNAPRTGIGNVGDSAPPAGLDWDMWLGPAPKRPFNANRFGVDPEDRYFSRFRWFWDYAGGMMTDWGVHLIDIVQWALDEAMPKSVTAMGGKLWFDDNRETPDTLQVTYTYPDFVLTYENREGNGFSGFGKGYGILFCGERATMFVDRSGYEITPEPRSGLQPFTRRSESGGNGEHWRDFLDCMKSRARPVSDIETCHRSTTACLLGNLAYRSGERIDFDAQKWQVRPTAALKAVQRETRKPWTV